MNTSRRHFMGQAIGVAGVSMAGFANHVFAQSPPKNIADKIKDDERDVIARMTQAGYANFVLLNKTNSMLSVVKEGEFFLQTPVIIGRRKGNKSLTSSGVFSLTNVFRGESLPLMVFDQDELTGFALHAVVPGREYAFQVDSVTAKRLSEGCVNIPKPALPYILGFARHTSNNDPNGMATPMVVTEENYSPTRFQKTLDGFIPQKYNPD